MKNRKTVLHVIFAVVMAMSLTLSACTKAEAPNNTATNGPTKGVDATGDPNLVAYNTPLTTFMEPFTGAQDPYAGLAANLGVIPAGSDWLPAGFSDPLHPALYTTFVVTSVNGVAYDDNGNESDLVAGLDSISNPSTVINNTTVYYAQVTVTINQGSKNPSFASLDNASSPVVIGITATNTYLGINSETNLTVVLEPVNPVDPIVPNDTGVGVTVIVNPSGYNNVFSTEYETVTNSPVDNGVFAPLSPLLSGQTENPVGTTSVNYNMVGDANVLQLAQRYITAISALACIIEPYGNEPTGGAEIGVIDIVFGDNEFSYVSAIVLYDDSGNPGIVGAYTDDNGTPNDYTDDIYYGWQYTVYDKYNNVLSYDLVGAGAAWIQDEYTVEFWWGVFSIS
jgi:hypothetical protein